MAVPAKEPRVRNPNDPVQRLRTKKHGLVEVDSKFWIGGPGIGTCIIKTPAGGYRRKGGAEIRDRKELIAAIPQGPELDEALRWWENKDSWQKSSVREVGFEKGTGYPIFTDTGEYVEDPDDLERMWPCVEPTKYIFYGAIAALNARQANRVPQKAIDKSSTLTLASVNREQDMREFPAPAVPAAGPVPSPPPKVAQPAAKAKGSGWTPERLAKARATKEANKAAKAVPLPE